MPTAAEIIQKIQMDQDIRHFEEFISNSSPANNDLMKTYIAGHQELPGHWCMGGLSPLQDSDLGNIYNAARNRGFYLLQEPFCAQIRTKINQLTLDNQDAWNALLQLGTLDTTPLQSFFNTLKAARLLPDELNHLTAFSFTPERQKEIFNLILAKRDQLVAKNQLEEWINALRKHGATQENIAALDALATATDATQVRAVLSSEEHRTVFGDIKKAGALPDETLERLKKFAISSSVAFKIQTLDFHNVHYMAALNKLLNATDLPAVRGVLSADFRGDKFGEINADDTTIFTDAGIQSIGRAATAHRKKLITDVINSGFTAMKPGDAHVKRDKDISNLQPLVDAPNDADLKALILAGLKSIHPSNPLITGLIVDGDWLENIAAVKDRAKKKLSELHQAKITDAIATIQDASSKDLLALAQAGSLDQIRNALDKKPTLGGVDFKSNHSNQNYLTNAAALDLRQIAVKKLIELKIAAETPAPNMGDLVRAPSLDEFRTQAARLCGFTPGNTLTPERLSDSEAAGIQRKLIEDWIVQSINDFDSTQNRDSLKKLATASNASSIKKALEDNLSLGQVPSAAFTASEISEGVLKNIRKIAIGKYILLSIHDDDSDIEHYRETLAPNADDSAIKGYLKTHLKSDLNLSIKEETFNGQIDALDTTQLQAIRDNIIAKQANLQDLFLKKEIRRITSMPTPWAWNLISRLSPDHKKALFDNKEGLEALLTAKTKFEITAACRLCGWNSSTFDASQPPLSLQTLSYQVMCENMVRRDLLQLQHATIAEFVAEKGLMLAPAGIERLNKKIDIYHKTIAGVYPLTDTPTFLATLFNDVEIFDADTKKIRHLMDGDIQIPIQSAFVQKINDQFLYNKDIYTRLSNATSSGEKAALGLLARIPKKQGDSVAALLPVQINLLTNAIKTADTRDKLIALLATSSLKTIVDTYFANHKAVITEEAFQYVKSQYARDAFIAPAGYENLIKKQAETIKELTGNFEAFTEADKAIRGEMERLSKLTGYVWLNPEVEGLARRYAEKYLDDFEQIGDMCDNVCRGLIEQRQAYRRLLQSMPTDEEIEKLPKKLIGGQRAAVKDHIDNINQAIKKLDDTFVRYNDLHRCLHGNPYQPQSTTKISTIAEKGILNIMRDAKEKTLDEKAKQALGVKSYPLAEKKKIFQEYTTKMPSDHPIGSGNTMMRANAVNPDVSQIFKNKGVIEPGQFHMYEVKGLYEKAPTAIVQEPKMLISHSAYTEEQMPISRSEQKKDASLPILFTVMKYPTGGPNLTADQEKTLKETKVEFVTKMAGTLLARMGRLPTPEHPITITGSNEEEVGMLWTALMLLGKNDSKWRFGEDSIKVQSAHFNPSTQKGFFGNYKSDSYHDVYFKSPNGQYMQQVKEAIKVFYEDSFGTEKDINRAQKNLDATTVFKEKLQDSSVKKGVIAMTPPRRPSP